MQYFHFFASCQFLTIRERWLLYNIFKGFARAFNDMTPSLLQKLHFAEHKISQLMHRKQSYDINCSQLKKANISVITWDCPLYPEPLRHIHDPPIALYARGNIQLFAEYPTFFAIVGPRKQSHYGKKATQVFSRYLADAGYCIISGLALGADATAHGEAVAMQRPTIAVLGSAIDTVYPYQNTRLAKDIIAQKGLTISEYPPDTTLHKMHFVRRNHLISGMSRGVFVASAPAKSGSLITARAAFEQNRPVFVAPQSIFDIHAIGTNNLIALDIARPVCTPAQLMAELENTPMKYKDHIRAALQLAQGAPTTKLTPDEQHVFNATTISGTRIDTYLSTLKRPLPEILRVLSSLELKMLIKNTGTGKYVRC